MQKVLTEAPMTSYLFSRASRAKIPLSGTFELSPVCNFSCKMCYVRKTPEEVAAHTRSMMSVKDWLKIAEEAKERGLLYLLLTGGEPLLHPHFFELYNSLSKMGFVLSINTNGSLIDDAVIAHFRSLPPSRVNITLYGASNETYRKLCGADYVFKKVDYAITKLKEAGIPVKLNLSLTPYNAPDLEAVVRYATERELILSVNTYMFPPLRRLPDSIGQNDRFTPEEHVHYSLEAYRLQYGERLFHDHLTAICNGSTPPLGLDEDCVDPLDGKIRCRAGNASFWITWDGYMTPCGMMPEPKVDCLEGNFAENWQKISEISEKLILSGTCGSCPHKELCHSCAAMALTETGTVSGIPQYLCQSVVAMQKEAASLLSDADRWQAISAQSNQCADA